MTVKDLRRILKKIADETEILVGEVEILRIERKFTDKKMQLIIILNKELTK